MSNQSKGEDIVVLPVEVFDQHGTAQKYVESLLRENKAFKEERDRAVEGHRAATEVSTEYAKQNRNLTQQLAAANGRVGKLVKAMRLIEPRVSTADKAFVAVILSYFPEESSTYENGGQESEAGAVYQFRCEEVNWIDCTEKFYTDWKGEKRILYTTPQYAQAIETAATIKCAEVCKRFKLRGIGPENDKYNNYIEKLSKEILALIPQDGRTALEDIGTEIATEVNDWQSEEKLREEVKKIIDKRSGR